MRRFVAILVVALVIATCFAQEPSASRSEGLIERLRQRVTNWWTRRGTTTPHPSAIESPDDLDLIAGIYKEAADNARASVQDLKRNVGDRWEETRHQIADIWKEAAEEAEKNVREVRRQASLIQSDLARGESPGHAERALEQAAARIQGIYANAAARARARADELRSSVDDTWESYRARLAEIWFNAAKEAEEQVRHLARIAASLGKTDIYTQPPLPSFAPTGDYLSGGKAYEHGYAERGHETERPGLRERAADTLRSGARQAGESVRHAAEDLAHRTRDAARGAADTVKGVGEKASHATTESYEALKHGISDVYHRAAESAKRQVESLKHVGTDTTEDMRRKVEEIYNRAARTAEEEVAQLRSRLPSLSPSMPHAPSLQGVKDSIGGAVGRAAETVGLKSTYDRAKGMYDAGSTCFTLGQWYEKAMETAREALNTLQQSPGSSWAQVKMTIRRLYDDAFGNVDKRIQDLQNELDHAKYRKSELDRIKEKLEDLPEQAGESWESQKHRIASLYDKAMADTQRGPLGRAYEAVKGTVENLFGTSKKPARESGGWTSGGGGWQSSNYFTDAYNSAARNAKKIWESLTPQTNTFDALKQKISDAFDRTYQEAEERLAELRRKPHSQMTAAERAQLKIADKTKKAVATAKNQLQTLTQSPGETFDQAKNRLWHVYQEVWEIAPSASMSAGESAWQSIRDTVGGAWQTLKSYAGQSDVPDIFSRKLEKAEHDAKKLFDLPGSDFSGRLRRIVVVYSQAVNDAEAELAPLALQVHNAQEGGQQVPADVMRQYNLAMMYLNALKKAINEAESISEPLAGENFQQTNERVSSLFQQAFQNAERDRDISNAWFLKRMRARFAHFLENSASKLGLHHKGYTYDKQAPASAANERASGWMTL